MRLDKFLADSGVGTRSEIKKIIKSGFVSVDGNDNVKADTKVNIDDVVFVNGKKIAYKKYIYLMLNKPKDCVSAVWDKHKKCVTDYVPSEYKNYDVFPVGRLDIDTEGLLILTNDGELTHKLLSPKYLIEKRYFAQVFGIVTNDDIEKFKTGVILEDGYKTKPAELIIKSSGEISIIEIMITEGKFHQIKRMFEAVGKKVIYLKRLSMNKLNLDESLEIGMVKELDEEELKSLCFGLN